MSTVHPRYLVDEHQRPTDVVLTIEQWQQIQDDLDQLEDIRAYDAAKSGPSDAVPLSQAVRELRGTKPA